MVWPGGKQERSNFWKFNSTLVNDQEFYDLIQKEYECIYIYLAGIELRMKHDSEHDSL